MTAMEPASSNNPGPDNPGPDNPGPDNQWITTVLPTPQPLLEQAQRLLANTRYCALSTCSADGLPWISPLLFTVDAQLRFYWSSAITARHSHHLYTNAGRSAIALFPAQPPTEGLYFTGIATELDATGVESILPLVRLRTGSPRVATDYLGDSPRRLYQFVPAAGWITGDRLAVGDQLVDTKITLDLTALRQLLAPQLPTPQDQS
jgi:hypothetical protein